jgi:hypothetical protein
MHTDRALHHLLKLRLYTARRRNTRLRLAASAVFSIHMISDFCPTVRRSPAYQILSAYSPAEKDFSPN